MADSGTWRWQMEVLRKQFPALQLVSGYRPGAITATGNPSYHGKGQAVDIPPRMAVFDWIATNYPNSAELIYSPAGNRQIRNGKPHVYTGVTKAQHYDHIHWAWTGGQTGGTTGAGIVTVDNSAPSLNPLQPFIDTFNFFTAPGLWLRIGIALAGAALLMLGLAGIAGRSATTIVKDVTRAR